MYAGWPSLTLYIHTPPNRQAERTYIIEVIFTEWLGLEWQQIHEERDNISIRLDDSTDGEISLPDSFLNQSEECWLQTKSLPTQPLPVWDTRDLVIDLPLMDSCLPVIYGDANPVTQVVKRSIRLPLDILGSAFFMLTRYEELACPVRDAHDRFPSWASVAAHGEFLERPIIDEYVEILWAALHFVWPSLTRKARCFGMVLSHDVDSPARYSFSSPVKLLKRMGGDLIKRGDLRNFVLAPIVRLHSNRVIPAIDPYNTFNWIMELSERHGLRSAFYFICGRTDANRDSDYEIEHLALRDLLKCIHARGHEIGLHPSYNTYQMPDAIKIEAKRLRDVCSDEAIQQEVWGGRMHYLRYSHPETLRGWELAGMDYDSTLGYADHIGFRCGTCHEYRAFDLFDRRKMNINIRPLVVMECSVMADRYMGLGVSEKAFTRIIRIKEACRVVKGNFTLLWHNLELNSSKKRLLYEQVLSA
jgi:Family of unknown function (DUF7033)